MLISRTEADVFHEDLTPSSETRLVLFRPFPAVRVSCQDGTFESGEVVFAPEDGAQLVIVISGQALEPLKSLKTATLQVAVTKQRVKTREEGELVFVDESVDVTQCTDKACEWSHTL